jgi:hypothetical protein
LIVRPDPDALMAGGLGDWLAAQNNARADAKARATKWVWRGILAACVVTVSIILFGFDIGTAFQFGFFTGLAGFGIAELIKRPVINSIKGGINGAIARALDMQFTHVVTPGAEFETVKAFDMLPSHDRASFEDCWRGTVGDRSFLLYEADLEERRSSGKSVSWETVFRGSIIEVEFARRFLGVTLVERAGRRKRLFGLLGDADSVKLGGIELARIAMVDPRFEDEFAVWSNDQVEARYLVHPEYIERLIAVEQAFSGEKIRALFSGGSLLIVLESGNLFESGSLDASDDRRLLERSIDQFGTLADLAVKLNERPR